LKLPTGLGRKALADVATAAQPDTLFGWYRKLIAKKFDGSKLARTRSWQAGERLPTSRLIDGGFIIAIILNLTTASKSALISIVQGKKS
jgi:hypothetical protein